MYIPLHAHDSDSSRLDGASKPEKMVDRFVKIGANAAALTNHGDISSLVKFHKYAKKKGVKPILGCEFYICEQDGEVKDKTNRTLTHLCVLAKNHQGWLNLVKAHNIGQKNFYYKPRISLETLARIGAGEFIVFSGHPGSDIGNILWGDFKGAYRAQTYTAARELVHPEWEKRVVELSAKYIELFGRENFFLECQMFDQENLPAQSIITKILRHIGKKNNIPCLATADSHYATKEDAYDQRLLLANSLGTTFRDINNKIESGEDVTLGGFFRSNNYHVPSISEMMGWHTEEEITNTLKIAEICEDYEITSKPRVPEFPCPEGRDRLSHLKYLCEEGARKLGKDGESEYQSRLEYELQTVMEFPLLADYFLIVHDYVDWARNQGWVCGARGSCGGSLIARYLNLSDVDPILYRLQFERFYNAGRNSKDNISLPDIDMDFPVDQREKVISRVRNTWGHDKVAQIATFGRMQGRSVVKDVLRVHNACTFAEMNEITDCIPDEAKIADELQQMREAGEDPSIVRWALIHRKEALKKWVELKEDGTVDGSMARYFEQAMRIEGTYRSVGKHAAGLIVAPYSLSDNVPMLYDKGNPSELMVGVDMKDAEAMGLMKADILGVAALDVIGDTINLINGAN
jgi:DNA polymerase-3 subunit alpha